MAVVRTQADVVAQIELTRAQVERLRTEIAYWTRIANAAAVAGDQGALDEALDEAAACVDALPEEYQ